MPNPGQHRQLRWRDGEQHRLGIQSPPPGDVRPVRRHCRAGRITIGKLWLYKPPADAREQRRALNFSTKRHWKYPSKVAYLAVGLEKFLATYREKCIQSIAFPILGAANGGIPEDESLAVMQRYLSQCDIPVEIYR